MVTMFHALTRLLPGWRLLLPLVIVSGLLPGRAGAECGDYLTVATSPHSWQPPHSGPSGDPMGELTHAPAPLTPPCHGPNCSSAPARHAPSPTSVAPDWPPVKEFLKVAGPAERDPGVRPPFAFDPTSPRPVRGQSAIFHPPRLVEVPR